MIFPLLLFIIIFYILYKYKKVHYYFDTNGLKYLKGVPVFGNVWKSVFLLRHVVEDFDEVYKAFPGERYVGYIEGTKPVILIRDPELMKDILIKDFDHFVDRKLFFPPNIDPYIANSVIGAPAQVWKKQRTRLTPAFTANKLRYMLSLADEVVQEITLSLKDKQTRELELTDVLFKYVSNATMYAAFGVRNWSKSDRDKFSIEISLLGRLSYFFSLHYSVIGEILNFLGLSFIPHKMTEFFKTIILHVIENRKKNNDIRQDFVQILSDLKDEWSMHEVVGQAFFSYIANTDTGSNVLVLCCHELALSPDVEEKLYQEIRKHKEVEGPLSYDNISSLKYLDCVLSEALRKWAASIVMDRICTKPYWLPPPREGGKPFLVKPGQMVFNIINPIHMDPQYHPNPEVFDPDRFSDENKHKIKPATFMPFGLGPRGCMGRRFASIIMKVVLYHMVLNFKITSCDRTVNPIQMLPDEFTIKCKGGTWVRLENRV